MGEGVTKWVGHVMERGLDVWTCMCVSSCDGINGLCADGATGAIWRNIREEGRFAYARVAEEEDSGLGHVTIE